MSEALERKRRRNEPREREGVRNPERFSDAYAPPDPEWPEKRGPEATAIAGLLARSCCGWRRRPTSAEFYDAIRAEQPSARQEAIVDVLMFEASEHTMTLAYLQGAFTWRQLARAIAKRPDRSERLAAYVNREAEAER